MWTILIWTQRNQRYYGITQVLLAKNGSKKIRLCCVLFRVTLIFFRTSSFSLWCGLLAQALTLTVEQSLMHFYGICYQGKMKNIPFPLPLERLTTLFQLMAWFMTFYSRYLTEYGRHVYRSPAKKDCRLQNVHNYFFVMHVFFWAKPKNSWVAANP